MKTNRAIQLLAGLSLIGAVISVYQTSHFHQIRSGVAALGSFCNFGSFSCDTVALSNWAELLPSVPLSALALGFYLALLIALFSTSFRKNEGLRNGLITLMAGGAAVFSAFYLVIMLTVVEAGCLLCLTIDAINFVLFTVAWMTLKPREIHLKAIADHKGTLALMGGTLVACLALGTVIGRDPNQRIDRRDVEDYVTRALRAPIETVALPSDIAHYGVPPQEAKVVVVKFFDYQCPSCRVAAEALHPLVGRYGKKGVSFVFRNYPLDPSCNSDIKRPMHPWACEAARLALCAQEQGEFSRVYEVLFREQSELTSQNIRSVVLSEVQDSKKMEACLNDPASAVRLARDLDEAQRLKIQSTPTFFVNGRRIPGAYPTPVWEALLDQLLKEANQ